MNTMVEMRLAADKHGGSERFSCKLEFWTLMVRLGETFGWSPLGSTYVAIPIRQAREPEARKRDYQPGTWRDAKLVAAQDASRWANALSTARASSHLNNLTQSHRGSLEQAKSDIGARDPTLDAPLDEAIDEFIRFLHKGSFSFAAGGADEIASMSARK